ncbi:MAG: hypothetical protein E6K71_00390 [Candidatus Eisenbacteria bacterium]|uniref:T9SS type A sorting domain-containing protein n=1 Tax=Eiseniibacteriota bacterium TaxID=2212470 RepID=A0A538SJ73_UNCEI|nr:MAG: hypothetical protein E6K71_00390 [Candidatus Eisenbacteria bacterium]
MRRRPFRSILVACLPLALLFASPASAQYMYLDSNGDGVHTAADLVHAIGPTVIDIWLDTAHNRDGSPTTCQYEPEKPLTIFSYDVILLATGGTVTYSSYTNLVSGMGPVGFPLPPDSVNFESGPFYTPTSLVLPAGKYLLGTLTVYAGSGTPSVDIAPGDFFGPFGEMTEFGSLCGGSLYPNTLVLGTDWFDIDGLAYNAGGGPNQSPRLTPPIAMVVPTGGNAVQPITANDPDGQPLSFTKISGPSFLYVTTLDRGTGTARGEIRVAPFASDAGSASASVSVSDGAAQDQATFGVTAKRGRDHPPFLRSEPALTLAAGQTRTLTLNAGDPDGGTVRFAKVSGPNFVGLRELSSRPGGASAVLTLSPTLCDVGSSQVSFSITDGVSTLVREMALSVALPVNDGTVGYHLAGFMHAIQLADMNRDGMLDVVAVHEDQDEISVYLNEGRDNLALGVPYPVSGQDGGIATGDFDEDGKMDVAVTDPAGAVVDLLLGKGDGTLLAASHYATGVGPGSVAVEDFNRDGHLDLITNNEEAGTVSVLLGTGKGTFAPKHDSPAGFRPNALAVGDFNLDGRPDAAVVGPEQGGLNGTLTVLPGLGDGTFGDGIQTSVQGYPFSVVAGDWNGDGRTDIAFTDISPPSTVQTFLGHGDGTFEPGVALASPVEFSYLFVVVNGDLNGDGCQDLIVSDVDRLRLATFLGTGNGTFASPRFQGSRYAQGLAIGDMDRDGRPDLVGTAPMNIGLFMNTFSVSPSVEVDASAPNGKFRPDQGTPMCVTIEGAHDPSLVIDPATVVLRSEGTGSVGEIHPPAGKQVIAGDTNRNGKTGTRICFPAEDVAALFDQLGRTAHVTAQISGSSIDGRLFCSNLDLLIDGRHLSAEPVFAPNPFNPSTRLTFSTQREGPAKAFLFDVQGRRVRTLLDTARLSAGPHDYRFDGKGDRGETLPSSVYFYRVQSTEGTFEGRIIILK